EDDETSKDKEIDKLMALISLSFKKIYKPTNNKLQTSSNTSGANQDNSSRINRSTGYENQRIGNVVGARETVGSIVKPKRVKDAAYHREKMLLCKQEEARIQLNVEQADWRDDTDDDELEDQELEAHYMYMAQLQEVSPDATDFGPIFDAEPLHKVSHDDHYNVFAIESEHPEQSEFVHVTYPIEQDAHNVIIDSLDMSYDREEIDQNDDDNDLANERELLASLIEKLKCEIDESKNHNKFLETSNKDLKAQLQDKGIVISELKKLIEKLKGKSVDTKFEKSSVIRQPNAFKSQRPTVLGKPTTFSYSFERKDFSKSKFVTQNNVSNDFSKPVNAQTLPPNKKSILKNMNVLAPGMYKLHTESNQARTSQLPQDSRKTNKHVSFSTGVIPTTSVSRPQLKSNPMGNRLVEIVLFIVDSGCSKHMTRNLKLLINFVEKFLGTVKFVNDQITPILGYGDLVQGAVTIKRIYYVEGLNHNLFFVGQFCDADLEVAFRKSTCYIRDLKGNDLLTDHVSSDPAPECQSVALEHNSLSSGTQCQENVTQADKTVTTSDELDLLFSPMFDELLNGSSKVLSKSSVVTTTDAPNQRQQHTTPLNTHTTPKPTCQVPTQVPTVTSNGNINQEKWLKNMLKLKMTSLSTSFVPRTRRQLESDGEMCMFALTISHTEPKNIKEAMADSAWIKSMQEELHRFD
nr:integrase, catalytic region, zinc finger, CCHC-type, peptidase aspartic, catalytic [Tanacetum cinerariifolium]